MGKNESLSSKPSVSAFFNCCGKIPVRNNVKEKKMDLDRIVH